MNNTETPQKTPRRPTLHRGKVSSSIQVSDLQTKYIGLLPFTDDEALEEFLSLKKQLNLRYEDIARLLGASPATAHAYASKTRRIPESTRTLIRLWLKLLAAPAPL